MHRQLVPSLIDGRRNWNVTAGLAPSMNKEHCIIVFSFALNGNSNSIISFLIDQRT